ncbi:putative HVA22-like protein g [Typha angustifolia]|uniref:putative HVA22-like protein g n=1 Tax=Typha angustifolia TaxID=59011 RepID=UPI003C300072
MLGDFLTRSLVLLFGYTIPAFECFKLMEQQPSDVGQLRFWCQYWTIVAMVTVFEKFADVLISWLPMYGEAKLAFFVYLWYPKTRGSDLVYETFLKPFVMQYEPDIEQRLRDLRAKSGQLLLFYIKNFTDKGTQFFLEILHHVVSPTSSSSNIEMNKRSGSHPITIKRPSSPLQQAGVHESGALPEFTAEELWEDAAVSESLRAATRAMPRRRHY